MTIWNNCLLLIGWGVGEGVHIDLLTPLLSTMERLWPRVKGGSLQNKKRVPKGRIAQCRGVECAKNTQYNDNQLPILFVVRVSHASGHAVRRRRESPQRHGGP